MEDKFAFMTPEIKEIKEIVNVKLHKLFRKNNLTITVDANSDGHRLLVYYVNLTFKQNRSRQIAIKLYYLYQFLIKDLSMGDELYLKDIMQAVGISSSNNIKSSSKLLRRCNDLFHLLGILDIDKNSHYKGLHLEDKQFLNFEYSFYHAGLSIGLHDNMQKSSSHACHVSYVYSLPIKLYNKLYSMGFQLHDDDVLSLFHIIPSHSKANSHIHNRLSLLRRPIYIADYSSLKIEDITMGEARKMIPPRKLEFVFRWFSHSQEQAKFSGGRLYHAFHSLPREARKLIRYNGSPLVEAMDVKNCYWVMLIPILRANTNVDRAELDEYTKMVRDGVIYERVMQDTARSDRDVVKQRLSAYRNVSAKEMKSYPEDAFFQRKFPTIREALAQYPSYLNREGKQTKRLQRDSSFVETHIISEVSWRLKELEIEPFPLHDAIYITEVDKAKLEAINASVESLFWEVFDSISDNDIKELLKYSEKSAGQNEECDKSDSDLMGFDPEATLAEPDDDYDPIKSDWDLYPENVDMTSSLAEDFVQKPLLVTVPSKPSTDTDTEVVPSWKKAIAEIAAEIMSENRCVS